MRRKCGCGAKFTPERKNQRSCSPACRKAAYECSDKARARKKRYEASAKGKAASEKYAATSKGKVRHLRHYYKDRPEQLRVVLKNRARWTKDVHAFVEKHGLSLLEALAILHGSKREHWKELIERFKWKWRDTQRDNFINAWYWDVRRETERRASSDVPPRDTSTSTMQEDDSVVLVG